MRAVDLDLFVNSASRGFNDGLKSPSVFGAFAQGVLTGIDDNQKDEAQDLINQQKRIEIENAPIETSIRESEAKIKESEAAVRSDPAYIDAAKAKLEAEQARAQEQARLDQKKMKLDEIMSGPDGELKGKVLTSGEFADVFAQTDYKDLREGYVQQTYREWKDPERGLYGEEVRVKNNKDWYNSETWKKKSTENEFTFNENSEVARLIQDSKLSPSDFVTKAEMRDVYVSPPVPKTEIVKVPNPDKPGEFYDKTVKVKDEFGNQVTMPDESLSAKPVKQRALFIDGKQVSDSVSSDAEKAITNYQYTYKLNQKMMPEQGGLNDLNRQVDRDKENKAKQEAAAKAQASKSKEAQLKGDEAFMSSFKEKINPAYQKYADQVIEETTANIAENKANAPQAERKNYTEIPSLSKDMLFNKALDYASADKDTKKPRTIMFQGVPSDEPAWAAKIREKQEMAAAKVSMALKRRTDQNLPASNQQQQLPPAQQAKQVTTPTNIPSNFKVLNSSAGPERVQASKVVVEKVNNVIKDSSAFTKAVAAVESEGDPDAISPRQTKNGQTLGGAKGLMQFTSKTAEGLAPGADVMEPRVASFMGAVLLQEGLSKYSNPMLALIAYNAGPDVASALVRESKSTSWSDIKAKIPEVVGRKYKNPDKVQEVMNYADKVAHYFPMFVSTSKDMVMARRLKDSGILDWEA